ncbi:energy transducer TonB [Rhodoferax sp.]|uniref:energy transducer TonB n=1 Tax=Rhodoferax sp. TaxID=50421 RepID=UPI00274C9D9A|nr:energy transducer TonB [Rhodoferax sp.]
MSFTGSSDAPTPPAAPEPAGSAQATAHGQGLGPEDRRLALGLFFSLLFHALLLSLTFGGQGLGLPGFGFPWQDRRIEAPDLHVVLVPALVPAAEPLPSAGAEQPGAAEPAMMTVVSPAPPLPPAPPSTPSTPSTPPPLIPAAIVPLANPKQSVKSNADAAAPAAPTTPAPAPVPVPVPVPAEQPKESAPPPTPHEEVMAVAQSDQATWAVPAAPAASAPVTVAAASPLSPQPAPPPPRDVGEAELTKQDAQRKAEQMEAERQAAARQEAVRQEAARQEVVRQEAARVEAARVESERQEAAKQTAAKQEAARQESARQEATRQQAARAEATRVEAERQAASRQESARQEAARAEAARGEAARQEAGRVEAARLAALQAEAEKREERLRAIGRQLNEEADRRDAAARQSPAWSGGRRARLFGHTDANAELILYAEAWSRKIHLNMTFDMVREAAKQRHTDPLVTVAIRSDGSVESVTFVRSSGVPALDEAIRRVVHSQANYQAFPPGLLQEYDVIEIRRTWHFDMAIRLQ